MSHQTDNKWGIGGFAEATGVNLETIRFYQRKGLLPESRRAHGSIRRYGEADVARVRFVRSTQHLGFSLDEVAGLLALDDDTHCDEARQLGEQKLADVRSKLVDLRRIESALAVGRRLRNQPFYPAPDHHRRRS